MKSQHDAAAAHDSQFPPCCPPLEKDDCCDVLEYRYRLVHRAVINEGNRTQVVPVEVITHVKFERCPGPLLLGEPVYSTTLLPGEEVRLFSSDRNTRFSFDSQTKVSYRHAQSSEESYFMASVDRYMSDLTISDRGASNANSSGSWNFHGDASAGLGFFSVNSDVNARGSHNAQSHSDFVRELSQHASSSHNRAMQATRAANSVQIGEVSSRTHIETESEDHFESASRVFRNPNKCHAVTFLFYRINKRQTVKFTLVGIHRRVIDPAGDNRVSNRAFLPAGDVSVIPDAVLGTAKDRIEVQARARQAVLAQGQADIGTVAGAANTANLLFPFVGAVQAEPLSKGVRAQALEQVDKDLVEAGLLDKVGGEVTEAARKRFSFERCLTLPTAGVIVKGCLDDCDVCEPTLMKEIEIEIEHKRLQNELLRRQIELLEKAQEYRCCPQPQPAPEP